ncbi:MAG: ISAs1 family transposase [Acetobacteraceae bacterium]|nr:ISAs1 family transposase [Acetobacteraceae bacterium]
MLPILLAVFGVAEAFTGTARFGERKIELRRRFRPYVNGTPSHDHLGDIFAMLDARAFQLCFATWVAALLDMMSTEGAVVTIDAMGCQRNIATKIIEKKADYILALKGNQGTLRENVEVFVDEHKALKYKGTTIRIHLTVDADHGCIETQSYTVIHNVDWLQVRP